MFSVCYSVLPAGVPSIVRSDLGTENSTIACLHPFLRRHGRDSVCATSFRYGRSVSNQVCNHLYLLNSTLIIATLQRIEAWWGVLRRWNCDWWIDFFKVHACTKLHPKIVYNNIFLQFVKNLKMSGDFDETDPLCV